mmetsp:Transcript_64123/g.144633  ORF Transcript_64123/g.144633 Transcript_64123/m.144633 type:complete len:446 (-) Transcript_64123:434-1771(-)
MSWRFRAETLTASSRLVAHSCSRSDLACAWADSSSFFSSSTLWSWSILIWATSVIRFSSRRAVTSCFSASNCRRSCSRWCANSRTKLSWWHAASSVFTLTMCSLWFVSRSLTSSSVRDRPASEVWASRSCVRSTWCDSCSRSAADKIFFCSWSRWLSACSRTRAWVASLASSCISSVVVCCSSNIRIWWRSCSPCSRSLAATWSLSWARCSECIRSASASSLLRCSASLACSARVSSSACSWARLSLIFSLWVSQSAEALVRVSRTDSPCFSRSDDSTFSTLLVCWVARSSRASSLSRSCSSARLAACFASSSVIFASTRFSWSSASAADAARSRVSSASFSAANCLSFSSTTLSRSSVARDSASCTLRRSSSVSDRRWSSSCLARMSLNLALASTSSASDLILYISASPSSSSIFADSELSSDSRCSSACLETRVRFSWSSRLC